jgi:hypothetical protein
MIQVTRCSPTEPATPTKPETEPTAPPTRRTEPSQPDPAPLTPTQPDRETCPDEGPCPFRRGSEPLQVSNSEVSELAEVVLPKFAVE